jgi:hypothetical protein
MTRRRPWISMRPLPGHVEPAVLREHVEELLHAVDADFSGVRVAAPSGAGVIASDGSSAAMASTEKGPATRVMCLRSTGWS